MCLNPIKIYNRAEFLGPNSSAYITVPCGKCAECQKQKHSDYTVRAYWEYKDTLKKGGYCYFDTLTYNDKNLPRFYGIPCFSKEDIRLFLVNLRRQLEYHFDIKNAFRYFITSEYGGQNHRPHYHILFFVTEPKLDVLTLKKFINKCWTKGFTDTLLKTNDRVVNRINAINYVSKYVTKDQDFQEEVDKKIYRLKKLFGTSDRFEIGVKNCKPFFRLSKHFGECALQMVDSNILDKGKIWIEDSKVIKKELTLGNYYKRKLFYDLIKTEDGKYRWKLNDKGLEFKKKTLDESIEKMANRFINNPIKNTAEFPIATQLVKEYLGNRSWKDFATYLMVYKGKKFRGDRLPEYHQFYEMSLKPTKLFKSDLYSEDSVKRSNARSKVDQIVVNQYRFNEFKNFDSLYILLEILNRDVNQLKQKYSDDINKLRSKLKSL